MNASSAPTVLAPGGNPPALPAAQHAHPEDAKQRGEQGDRREHGEDDGERGRDRQAVQEADAEDAAGTAVMRATASQQLMAVTLHAPRQPAGFYEVWLLARDGVSMISLGDLNASHTGTFVVPPGTDLRNYSRIDISLQPFNGSTRHSGTSVVRGSWPAAALGGAVPPH